MIEEKAVNSTHNLTDIFGGIDYNPNPNDPSMNQFDPEQGKGNQLARFLELDFLGYVEEKFQCSGMCNKGLFYFSRNITEGIPEKTCLSSIHTHLVEEASGLGGMSTFVALLALWCFGCHFFLYCKGAG